MNIDNIPNELKKDALWCLWRDSKIPHNPKTGDRAKSNDPDTFSDFQTVYEAYNNGVFVK